MVRLVQQPLPQSEGMRAGLPKKDIKRIKDRELMTATEKEENDIFAERKCPYCPFTIYNERPERKKSVSGQWSMDNVYFTPNAVLDTWKLEKDLLHPFPFQCNVLLKTFNAVESLKERFLGPPECVNQHCKERPKHQRIHNLGLVLLAI